jgi:hypothetical protein
MQQMCNMIKDCYNQMLKHDIHEERQMVYGQKAILVPKWKLFKFVSVLCHRTHLNDSVYVYMFPIDSVCLLRLNMECLQRPENLNC